MKQIYSKQVNDDNNEKVYQVSNDRFGNLCVEEIRLDGYYTKLGMNEDQLFNFEGMLLKNGWRKI